MTTFTIDSDNNITAFASAEEAAATTATPFDTFANQKELAELAVAWPAERLIEIWNSLAGVVAAESFKSSKTAVSRIWARIQSLGETAKPKAAPAKPKANRKAKGGAQAAKGRAREIQATKKSTAAKNAPKDKNVAKSEEASAPREGSKTAQVVAMLIPPAYRRRHVAPRGAFLGQLAQQLNRATKTGGKLGVPPRPRYRKFG